MRHFEIGGLLACALVLLSTTSAQAQEMTPAQEGVLPPGHQLTLYGRAGGMLYLSDALTTGGFGGGVGVRDTLRDRFILQADLSFLMGIGNVGALRLGAGVQRSGTWTPAVLATLSVVMGDRLTFLTPAHPTPLRGPAVSLGVSVAPLRFTQKGMQLSLLELGVGAGSDLPGTGLAWHLGLLEVGTHF
ncbi:hypothetical protein [Archangium violaceum]|uniref:hypothetical protein n=1 Tax=Archangium violaceum TaxID=83451 RepID=UPI0036DAEBE6